MEIFDYVRSLRRNWFLILGCAALAVGAAWIATVRTTPRYAASITMFVAGHGANEASAYQASLLSEERVKSYAHLLTDDRLIGALAHEQPGLTAEQLRSEISADVVPDTVLLRATVRDQSPARARAITNALGTRFIRLVDELERPATGGAPLFKVTVVDGPRASDRPVSPDPVANLAIGLLTGLAFGVGAGLLREALDTTVKTVERLRTITGGPVLGVIESMGKRPPMPAHGAPESYRFLSTNLRFAGGDRPVRSVVVTAARPRDGASSTACGLAVALAHAGARVVLLDCALRDPGVSHYLGIAEPVGLTSVLRGQTELDQALCRWRHTSLSVLPCGPDPASAAELLGGPRMWDLLDELAKRADVVIVDAPPLLSVSDAAVLARYCDGAVLVTRHGRTTNEQLRRAVDQLDAVDARLLGTVLNQTRAGGKHGYGHASSPAAPSPHPNPAPR